MSETIITDFVEANGLRFEVDMCGSGDTLVLCLHGFPEHSIAWRFQLPMLAEMGYKVWAPNSRGYGNSSVPKGVSSYNIDLLVEDVGALFDASGCPKLILMGHDWGAVIAWHFAINKVRPLERLIIANVPHPGPFAREIAANPDQRKKSWYIAFFQVPWLPELYLAWGKGKRVGNIIYNSATNKQYFPPEVIEVYRENAARRGGMKAMINYYRAAVRRAQENRKKGETREIPLLDTPTLMIWGEADFALSKEVSYGTDKWVPNLTIRYLPGISHWVQQDAPESFNAILTAWLHDEPIPESGPDGIVFNLR